MIDYNSPEEVAKRANQEDPIVMYLIVRESLNMSMGKTAAQCGHAVGMLHLKYAEFKDMHELGTKETEYFREFSDWLNNSFRKIVLGADSKEWIKLKTELSEGTFVVVVDAGLTQLAPNTETVIGVMPMHKSMCPKIIKRLQVLK